MRFNRELDSLVMSVMEDSLNVELVEKEIGACDNIFEINHEDYDYSRIKLKNNHVVIAEHRTRKEHDVEEDNRYGVWLEESVVSHVKMLSTGDIYTVSYVYIATAKSDDVRDIKFEQLGNEEEIIEIVREQYREFDEEAIEVDVDDVNIKVSKKRFKKFTKESSVALNLQ